MTDQLRGDLAAVQFTGVLLESRVVMPLGEIPGLDLHIGPAGIFMINAASRSTQSVEYDALGDLRCGDLASLPDGSPATILSAVVAGRPLRWLIPAAQLSPSRAEALGSLLRHRIEVARWPTPSVSPPVAGQPTAPAVTTSEPTARAPVSGQPTPVQPTPVQPTPVQPTPVQPTPVQPTPVQPTPVQPTPVQPTPVQPAPSPAPVVESTGWAPVPTFDAPHWVPSPEPAAFLQSQGGPLLGGPALGGPAAARPARRRLGPLLWTLVAVEVLLVAAAITIPIADQAPVARPVGGGVALGDRQLARQINLQPADLPSTWTIDRASDGPLSGFLGSGASSAAPSKQDTHLADQVAAQFEQCMGIAPSADRIFGPGGSTPSAASSSPAFAAPSDSPGQAAGAEEAGSSVDVYPSTREVAADLAQIANAKFPACFGAALGTSFVGAATSGANGDQVGQPQVQPITVPQRQGVTSSGVEVTIPLTTQGTTVPVQFGVVLIGGDRVEATLFTFSDATPFPPALTSSLSLKLADNIAAEGVGTAT